MRACASFTFRTIGRRLGVVALISLMLAASVARADYQAGLTAYAAGDYATALKEWQAAADKGDAQAQQGLGLLYDLGRGVPVDPAQAAKWYSLAAAQNMPDAQSNLGMLYAEGRGVDKNVGKANELWLLAGKAGNSAAQFNLGLSYYRGEGLPKSYPDAAKWFAAAAATGEVSAQYAIAEMYRLGRGVPKDLKAARRWFTKAANAGNAAAAERLASLPPDTMAGGGASTESVMNPTPLVSSTKTPTTGGTSNTVGGATIGTTASQTTVNPPAPSTEAVAPATTAATNGSGAIAPALVPSTTASTATTTQTSDGSGTTTVLTASGLTGPISPGNSKNADPAASNVTLTPNVVVPLGADAALTTKAQIPASTVAPAPALILPPSSTGVINLGLPLAAASSASTPPPAPTTVASVPAASESAGGADVFRVWIGTFKTEDDARAYWSQEVQRFPDLLKPLQLLVRQVDLGASQGIWFRVLGGPFDNRETADHLCGSIKSRSPVDDCRVVLN
jgi:uncharacterized protein